MCGIGVTSFIKVTSNPAACKDLIAASLPAPGPLTYTSILFRPCSIAALAAVSAAICDANGVLFLDPLKPKAPALDHDKAFPAASVKVTIELLKVDLMCAAPCSIFFLSFLLPNSQNL